MKVSFVATSKNKKTSDIPQTYSPSNTCPVSCPLRDKECYGRFSYTGMHWKKLDLGQVGMPWGEFLKQVRKIEAGRLWRHNIAGDLCSGGDEIDHLRVWELVKANRGRRGFSYTHSPLTPANVQTLRYANTNGFTINLSADSLQEADEAANANCGPVVVTIPSDPALWPTRTPEGRPVVVCPNVTHKVTCLECKLCAVGVTGGAATAFRRSIIGFPSHGTGKKSLDRRLAAEAVDNLTCGG